MLWDGITRRAFGVGGGGRDSVIDSPIAREPRRKLKIGLALGGGRRARLVAYRRHARPRARGHHPRRDRRLLDRRRRRRLLCGRQARRARSLRPVADQAPGHGAARFPHQRLGADRRRPPASGCSNGISATCGSRRCRCASPRSRPSSAPATRSGSPAAPLIDTMRASYALPGVFDPVKLGGRWLMDGALVNPIPVTVARALGADLVICVNLNGDIRIRGTVIQSHGPRRGDRDRRSGVGGAAPLGVLRTAARRGGRRGGRAIGAGHRQRHGRRLQHHAGPHRSLAARRRPARRDDLPRSSSPVGLFEFHRADECIELGREATERALPDIYELLEAARKVG